MLRCAVSRPGGSCVQLGGDGDDDDVVVAATAVSLRCPLSGTRMQRPAHFSAHSTGLACFDLDSFLAMTQRSGKLQCPFSMKLCTLQELSEEPFLAAVLAALSAAGLADSVDEVEVGPGQCCLCELLLVLRLRLVVVLVHT